MAFCVSAGSSVAVRDRFAATGDGPKTVGSLGMAENTDSTTVTEETNGQAEGFEPIASQEALDKIIQARIARERAKFADYDSLKAQASKLAEFEASQKTEAQKQQEALEDAQRQLAELTVAKAKAEVAAAKGVPAHLLSGSTQEELEAAADALIAFRGEQSHQQDRATFVIQDEGGFPNLALNGDGIELALRKKLGIA